MQAPGATWARRRASPSSTRNFASARPGIRSSPRRSAKIAVTPARDGPQVADLKGIPIAVERKPVRSGEKFVTPQGFTAIRDGIKKSAGSLPFAPGQKPRWLRAPLATGERYESLRETVREHRLSTVCEEAHCPNIGECWNAGTATLLLMGSVCTRACRFCAVDTGNPRGWLDRRRAGERGAHGRADGSRLRGADFGGPRRPAGRRRRAPRGLRARDQGGHPEDRGRSADAGFPGRARATSRRSSTPESRCSRRTSRRSSG